MPKNVPNRLRPNAFLITIFTLLILVSGCTKEKKDTGEIYLVRIDDIVVTVGDYKNALELAKTAYPYEDFTNSDSLKNIKIRLLNQMIEEIILQKQAEKNGITVTESEIETVVENIKSDYPEGEFTSMLLENVIQYDTWKDRLKKRLLMEKVIENLIAPGITVSPEEITDYIKSRSENTEGETGNKKDKDDKHPDYPEAEKLGSPGNEAIMNHLRRIKIEEAYKNWVDKHKAEFKAEINDDAWKQLLGSD